MNCRSDRILIINSLHSGRLTQKLYLLGHGRLQILLDDALKDLLYEGRIQIMKNFVALLDNSGLLLLDNACVLLRFAHQVGQLSVLLLLLVRCHLAQGLKPHKNFLLVVVSDQVLQDARSDRIFQDFIQAVIQLGG